MEELDYYTRTCRYCEKTFVTNHGNRFFCDPATQEVGERNCKVTYNNLKAKNRRDLTKDFERPLQNNWSILNELLENDRDYVNKTELISLGFNFDFYLSLESQGQGGCKDIYQVFNIDLISMDEEFFFIV